MNHSKQPFLHSLDLPEESIEPFIPFLLEDLWELGSMPEYILQLVRSHLNTREIHRITDFGCGKGAVLISLAREFDFHGVGIDFVPDFIASAQNFARTFGVEDRVRFHTGDILKELPLVRNQDLVIYGYDSEVLGNVEETLSRLHVCLKDAGHLILEVAYTAKGEPKLEGVPDEEEVIRQIKAGGFESVDQVVWDRKKLKVVNEQNNQLIRVRVDELIKKYPDKAPIFRTYMENQLEECEELENEITCATWLLRR